jgi:tyrosyl-tRNA synthetase
MSKSLGNHIPIMAAPADVYGKVMSIPDSALVIYFELATRYLPAQVEAVKAKLASGLNPRDVKMELAREIVSIFHGDAAVPAAEQHFIGLFQKGDVPDEMPDFMLGEDRNIASVIVAAGGAKSKNDARRLVDGGGVSIDGAKIADWKLDATPGVLKVGKRFFVRLQG